MRIVKVLGVLILLLLVAVSIMYTLGSRLPHEHTATVSAIIPASQDRVWNLINDVKDQPAWRSGLQSVQVLPAENGHPCWLEQQLIGNMPLCETFATPPSLRAVRIMDTGLAFGGSWTYQLAAQSGNETRLTITEEGITGPALWRFLGHYVFHEDTNIKQYLRALQKQAAKSK